jgi:hypothetical protein
MPPNTDVELRFPPEGKLATLTRFSRPGGTLNAPWHTHLVQAIGKRGGLDGVWKLALHGGKSGLAAASIRSRNAAR